MWNESLVRSQMHVISRLPTLCLGSFTYVTVFSLYYVMGKDKRNISQTPKILNLIGQLGFIAPLDSHKKSVEAWCMTVALINYESLSLST